MSKHDINKISNVINEILSRQWCQENQVTPIEVETNESGERVITIAIANLTYLATIGEFIKHRIQGVGCAARFVEMNAIDIQEILDQICQNPGLKDPEEQEAGMHDNAILDTLRSAETEDEAESHEFEFDDSEDEPIEDEPLDLAQELLGSQIQRAAAQILIGTCRSNVSDIHIEPRADSYKIRVRRDGVLQNYIQMPRSAGIKLTACLKNMARMNIAERRTWQEGCIQRIFEGHQMEFRCSTAPVQHGEKMVIRILQSNSLAVGLDLLITNHQTRESFRRILNERSGAIICAGRVGSGKSTTIAAALREKDNGELNICTIEDPVEYEMGGDINQIQVIREKGQTTPELLKTLMRADPDVILIGETRDPETAESFFDAAESGFLALTTVHAASCAQTIRYLQLLGVSPQKLYMQRGGILAQQLLRRVCPNCSTSTPCSETEGKLLDITPGTIVQRAGCLTNEEKTSRNHEGRLCARCAGSGYHGRMAVYEFLEFTQETMDRLSRSQCIREIQDILKSEGFISMKHAATQLVIDGMTTPEEAFKAVYATTNLRSDSEFESWAERLCAE